MDNKFNQEHYDFLSKCAKNNNIKAWNEWYNEQRVRNENFKLYLEEAHLENFNLSGAHLEYAQLYGTYLGNAYLEGAHLDNAILRGTYLDNIDLSYSYLNNAELINISFRNKKGEFGPFICKEALFRNAIFRIKECYAKKEEKEIIKAMSKAQLNNISFSDPIFGRKVRDEAWLYNWKQKNSKGIKKIRRFLWCTTCDYQHLAIG